MKRLIAVSLFVAFSSSVSAAEPEKASRFEEEFALSVRAGRGELSDADREALFEQNHIILAQIGDDGTRSLIELFASLPDASHKELVERGYLRWRFQELDEGSQAVFRGMVQRNLEIAKAQGVSPHPAFSLEELEKAQVGFAVVEIPEDDQKVVSLFILWPKAPDPTWVTVVNGRAAGTPAYFKAHVTRLMIIKGIGQPTSGAQPTPVAQPVPAPPSEPGLPPGAWWDDRTGGLIGGVGGTIVGLLGALIGGLGGCGKARRFVMGLAILVTVSGIAALLVGVVALGIGQPYAVYGPLLAGGGIVGVVCGGLLPALRRRYAEIELRRMTAMDVAAPGK